jgi:RNA-binding motif X-linked protein 2
MNVIREIQKINERELQGGVFTEEASWHYKYRDSAWVYIGGIPYELTEGDVLCVMSQFGEIDDINLVRDEDDGKSKGFAFLKYEDQRSTILAVDNFNGIELLGRTIRVDHCEQYKLPKALREKEKEALEEGREDVATWKPGHAYENQEVAGPNSIRKGVDVFGGPHDESDVSDASESRSKKKRKHKDREAKTEDKKKKKKKKHHRKGDERDRGEKKHSSRETGGERGEAPYPREAVRPSFRSTSIAPPEAPAALVQSVAAQAGGVADWRGLSERGPMGGRGFGGRGRGGRGPSRGRGMRDR